jgi:hypothetical protein
MDPETILANPEIAYYERDHPDLSYIFFDIAYPITPDLRPEPGKFNALNEFRRPILVPQLLVDSVPVYRGGNLWPIFIVSKIGEEYKSSPFDVSPLDSTIKFIGFFKPLHPIPSHFNAFNENNEPISVPPYIINKYPKPNPSLFHKFIYHSEKSKSVVNPERISSITYIPFPFIDERQPTSDDDIFRQKYLKYKSKYTKFYHNH